MQTLSPEDAKNLVAALIAGITFPEGWGASVVLGKCTCETPVINIEFENLDGRKGEVRVAHADKTDHQFHDFGKTWAEFEANELPDVITHLPDIKPGESGAFVNASLTYIPGLGTVMVVHGANIPNFAKFFGRTDD